jgi:hypothetical protein
LLSPSCPLASFIKEHNMLIMTANPQVESD